MQNVAAIILAAGDSERMGHPKALLSIEGKPALLTIGERLLEANFEPVVTVISMPLHKQLLSFDFLGPVVINNETEKGPLHSFRLGLRVLSEQTVAALLCPVDHPFVLTDTLRRLKASASENEIIVPVCQGKRGHPTLFGRDFWPLIFSLPLEEGARGILRRRLEAVRLLEVDDPGVLQNVNTPEDWTKARI
ncbi:MAG: nucleotidyltransferase family protein [Calditrichaeota bacterium]|nr:nucleotidyltransferase family protein [Calditrichota bacterium]